MRLAGIAAPALLALALASCAVGSQAPAAPVKSALSEDAQASDIAALRWIAKDSDAVAVLTSQPVECIKPTSDTVLTRKRELGRVAFESPALLGGSAGRKGLACGSCHLNGRGNVDLFIEGVSDKPGTADVTSSLFSKTRGDGEFNPKPIPDIAAKDGKQIKDRRSYEFGVKVRGLVMDEFDGQEPPSPVFEDLMAYLDALDIASCADPSARVKLVPQHDLDMVATALAGARAASDPAETEFWIRAARRRLEKIDERYLAADLAPVRTRVGELSAALGVEADAIHAGKPPTPPITAEGWAALTAAVAAGEPKSLYDPVVLKAALRTSTHPPGVR